MSDSDNITEPWDTDEIKEQTDVDLQTARYTTVHLSDPSEYSYKLIETVRQNEVLETPSATIDRALRIELAYLIDTEQVSFSRVEYDIKYTVPPPGWIFKQEFEERELIPYGKAGIEWANEEDRSVGTTTARVCKDMIDRAVEEGITESISGLCRQGLERMIGQREISNKESHYISKSQETSDVTHEYPIVTLFKGEAYGGLTKASIRHVDSLPTQWYRMGDLAEKADCSTNALRDAQDEMVKYGVLEKSDNTGNSKMPRYRIPNSIVVQLVNNFHNNYNPDEDTHVSVGVRDVSLTGLMGTKGRAQLIAWFIADAEKDTTYSKNGITKHSPVGHSSVRSYIDELAQLGIVNTKKVSRGSQTYTEYTVNSDSPINMFLNRLGEAIFVHQSVKEFDFD